MGRGDGWIATRELSIITRKQFVEMIQALLGSRAPFAHLTNDVYEGVFHKNASELREHLHLQAQQNPRDHFSVLALAYTIAAESASKIKLAALERYQEDEYLPISVVRDVIIVPSKAVGIQADEMAELLQIDILTGMPLLSEGA